MQCTLFQLMEGWRALSWRNVNDGDNMIRRAISIMHGGDRPLRQGARPHSMCWERASLDVCPAIRLIGRLLGDQMKLFFHARNPTQMVPVRFVRGGVQHGVAFSGSAIVPSSYHVLAPRRTRDLYCSIGDLQFMLDFYQIVLSDQ